MNKIVIIIILFLITASSLYMYNTNLKTNQIKLVYFGDNYLLEYFMDDLCCHNCPKTNHWGYELCQEICEEC